MFEQVDEKDMSDAKEEKTPRCREDGLHWCGRRAGIQMTESASGAILMSKGKTRAKDVSLGGH